MDDVEPTPDATTEPVAASEPVAEPSPSDAPPAPDAALRSREAAGYRTRLRAAEEQLGLRDAVIGGMREEIDRMHRADAERMAGELASPADLWLVTDLSELRDDAGRLDAEKVKSKVSEVLAERPSWRVSTSSFDGGARQPAPGMRQPGLADLLRPGSR